MTKHLSLIYALLLAVLFTWLPSRAQNSEAEQSASANKTNALSVDSVGKAALGIQTIRVQKSTRPVEIKTTGKIEAIPTREFTQHSMLSGNVTAVKVMPGDHVTAGQTLLIIDSPELNQLAAETLQTKEQIENDIKQAGITSDADIAQATAQYQLAQANYNRDKLLFDKGVAAQKDVQTSLADMDVAKSRVDSAIKKKNATLENLRSKLRISVETLTTRLTQMGVQASQIKEVLRSKHTITSIPVTSARAGIVTEILASAGQSISPNVPLIKVSDLSRVWATADIYEQDIASVHLNQSVAVQVAAFPALQFDGRLTFIGKQINAQTRTLPVRIEIANRDLKLTPDMFADLSIQSGSLASAILIPKEATVDRAGQSIVFKQIAGKYVPVEVKTARTFSDQIEVTSGLSPGDVIVSRGAFQLNGENNPAGGLPDSDDEPTAAKPTPASSISPLFFSIAIFVVFLLGFALSALVKARAKRERTITKDEKAEPPVILEK